MAHRVDKKFAFVAKDDGVVSSISDNHIEIKYQDGKLDKVKIGLLYGVSTGKTIDNRLMTDYKLGQEVKQGDVVAFHPLHFVRDIFNPSQVLFKNSVLARTCFMESMDTEEDSSAVSERLCGNMVTPTVKKRVVMIPFEDNVQNIVKVGDVVEDDSILCTLVSAVFSDTNLFGEEVLDTLEKIAQNTPKAKYPGRVSHIDLLYYGDPETAEVSDTVRKLIKHYDAKQAALSKKTGEDAESCRVDTQLRVDGRMLPLNHVALQIYIENTDDQGVGDKIVVSNQLKSVITRVMHGVNETLSGKPIDCIFGYQSVANRIVQSAELLGTANTLLKLITKEVVDIYRKAHPKK